MKMADIAGIIVLSLIAWVFFYLHSGPPDGNLTLGVVAIGTVLVLAFRWMRNRFKKEAK